MKDKVPHQYLKLITSEKLYIYICVCLCVCVYKVIYSQVSRMKMKNQKSIEDHYLGYYQD